MSYIWAGSTIRHVTIALIIVLAVIASCVIGVVLVRGRARSARDEIPRRLGTDRSALASNARLIGVQSRGLGQMRGTGTLALTSGELVFLMWVPRRELRIPRQAIESVATGHGVAGKRIGGKALHVRWRSSEGVDEAAWQVKNLDAWLEALSKP